MGDRCYLTVTLRACDIDRFGAGFEGGWAYDDNVWWTDVIAGDPDDRAPGSVVTLGVSEVNYGGDDVVSEAASNGLTFYGHHSEGDEYGPQMFAAHKCEALWQDCDHSCSAPIIPASEITGEPSKRYLKALKDFVRLRNKAKAYIEKGQV